MLDEMSGEIVLVHVDDILVGSRTKAEAKANEQKLGELLAAHPAGPLFMKHDIATLGQKVDFLGYRIRRRWLQFGGGIRLTPSAKAFRRFEKRLLAKLVTLSPSEMHDATKSYRRNWQSSMQQWDISETGHTLLYLTSVNIVALAKAEQKATGP